MQRLRACLTLMQGQRNRHVAGHGLNDRSSRSHTIFTLWVQTCNAGMPSCSILALQAGQLLHSMLLAQTCSQSLLRNDRAACPAAMLCFWMQRVSHSPASSTWWTWLAASGTQRLGQRAAWPRRPCTSTSPCHSWSRQAQDSMPRRHALNATCVCTELLRAGMCPSALPAGIHSQQQEFGRWLAHAADCACRSSLRSPRRMPSMCHTAHPSSPTSSRTPSVATARRCWCRASGLM